MKGEKFVDHPQKLVEQIHEVVMLALVADQRQTLVNMANHYGFDVSHWTIRNALKEIDIYNRVT